MGAYVNSAAYNLGAWITTVVVSLLSLLFILVTIFPSLLR
jgi:hypothetical protein